MAALKVNPGAVSNQHPTVIADLRAQSNPEAADAASFTRRYPKAIVRDFDGKPGMISEMDALVAYMQMFGTLIDLKLYDAKANIR